jgi:hypothetical protein
LISTLQDYKRAVDLYTLYYGEQWFIEQWKYFSKSRPK